MATEISMAYLEINITPINKEQSEICVALLSVIDYESFHEEENSLKAYVKEELFDEGLLQNQLHPFELTYQKNIMPEINWNLEWEKNYDPVIVSDKIAIRASFHEPITSVKQEIIITPKMSFGTGHHSTTHMMLELISELPIEHKSVLDYGCGTGVLGIYASLQGAKLVIGNDIDTWCVENTEENVVVNNIKNFTTFLGDLDALPKQKYDIILANINLNILCAQMETLLSLLNKDGILLCSGILKTDETVLIETAEKLGAKYQYLRNRLNWSAIQFIK